MGKETCDDDDDKLQVPM